MVKLKNKCYVIAFGKFKQSTKHIFKTKTQAIKKARELKKSLPYIKFNIKRC